MRFRAERGRFQRASWPPVILPTRCLAAGREFRRSQKIGRIPDPYPTSVQVPTHGLQNGGIGDAPNPLKSHALTACQAEHWLPAW
jgi:hypothetical protein